MQFYKWMCQEVQYRCNSSATSSASLSATLSGLSCVSLYGLLSASLGAALMYPQVRALSIALTSRLSSFYAVLKAFWNAILDASSSAAQSASSILPFIESLCILFALTMAWISAI